MKIHLNLNSADDYRMFLRIKALPKYSFQGRVADFPDEYAELIGAGAAPVATAHYQPIPGLFDYQRDISALAIRKQKYAVFADCGLGKALRYDEPVLTPDGWKSIGRLSVGDSVMGSSGKPCQVIGVYPQGVRELFSVRFTDGVEVVCDGDHLWNVKTQLQRYRNTAGRTLTTKAIIEEGLADGIGRRRHFIPLVCPVEFSERDLPIDPYTLGVLLGDGSFRGGSISLTTVDPEILGYLKLPEGVEVRLKEDSGGRAPSYGLSGTKGKANPLTARLRFLGLDGHLSCEKFIPEAYLRASITQRRALLAGLLDTDGSVCDGTVEFVTTSKVLADNVAELVQSLGGMSPIAESQPYYTYKGEIKAGRTAYRLNVKLPSVANPFRLIRKATAWQPRNRAEPPRAIESIRECGTDLAVCIAVDSPDNLYVTRGYVLTHNTLILAEFARHCLNVLPPEQAVLIVSPLMVVSQTVDEIRRFYPGTGDRTCDLKPTIIPAKSLAHWTQDRYSPRLGITNYDALTDGVECGKIGALILDESSMLKSQYGKWGQHCLRIGAGLKWKLCLTGTPAPNDRIEYANHAVFLDAFPTPNSFPARFFINRGQTSERWEMKAHAVSAFYRALSHWCIFLTNPATYGWRDNCGTVPPINVHIHDVELTDAQADACRELTGTLYVDTPGGITGRAKLARIAKGKDSLKPAYIRSLVESWPEESTIIWCRFNEEQDRLAKEITGCGSIDGKTPQDKRQAIIDEFKAGKIKTLVTNPKILGFGLNLQIATRQIFSALHDSYEEYYQAVKRSNRIGSTRPLNVHIPTTEAERPMIENVLRKAKRVLADTEEQEILFKTNQEFSHAG